MIPRNRKSFSSKKDQTSVLAKADFQEECKRLVLGLYVRQNRIKRMELEYVFLWLITYTALLWKIKYPFLWNFKHILLDLTKWFLHYDCSRIKIVLFASYSFIYSLLIIFKPKITISLDRWNGFLVWKYEKNCL